jgi:hypothetical protein
LQYVYFQNHDEILIITPYLTFSLPLSVFLYLLISGMNTGIEFASWQRHGIEYIQDINTLLKKMQQHRGMASAFLSGDVSFENALAVK